MKNIELIKLLKLAQGNRGQNQYAKNSDVPSATLFRYFSGERTPEPEILKKLATHAYNGVTHEDLMVAAGHMSKSNKEEVKAQPLTPAQTFIIEAVKNKLNEKQLQRVLGFVQALTQDQITKEAKAN